jgi:ferredoxin
MVMSIKIVFNREKCIGAYACIAQDPEKWLMANDGKVDLEGSQNAGKGIFVREITKAELERAKAAALVCPALAIEVVEE